MQLLLIKKKKKMKQTTTEEQREEIKEFIQTKLLRQGITAEILLFKEEVADNGKITIKIITDNFNTIPVIFKNIFIGSLDSCISYEKEDEVSKVKYREFSISLNVIYKCFDGGMSASRLFNVHGKLSEGKVYDLNIKV